MAETEQNNHNKVRGVLSDTQKRRLEELRTKMSENPDVRDWLQLELLDKQEKVRYTPGINSDYQLGQLIQCSDLIRKLDFKGGGINEN